MLNKNTTKFLAIATILLIGILYYLFSEITKDSNISGIILGSTILAVILISCLLVTGIIKFALKNIDFWNTYFLGTTTSLLIFMAYLYFNNY